MSQMEILEFLYNARTTGDDSYFSPKEIFKGAGANTETAIRKQINKLFFFGFLDVKTEKKWRMFSDHRKWKREFRLSKTHIKKFENMRFSPEDKPEECGKSE